MFIISASHVKAACLRLQLLVQVVENVQRASIYCRRPHPELKKTTMKQVTAKIVLLDFMGHLMENIHNELLNCMINVAAGAFCFPSSF